jgi:simple sugar transport system permease protein
MKSLISETTVFAALKDACISAVLILVSVAFGGLLIAMYGFDPLQAYGVMLCGAFGNPLRVSETLVSMTILLLTGLGTAVAYRCGIWNIGAEGQLYLGALGATWAALAFSLPFILHLPLSLFFGFVFGGFWALIPGVLKAKRGTNEILTTLMMNYIGIWLVHYAVHFTPLKDPNKVFPQSYDIPVSATLPKLMQGSRLHAGMIVAFLSVVAVYLILRRTTFGYSIKATGENIIAARVGGINVSRVIMLTMLVSGGLSGLAGAGEVLGVHGWLQDGISPGYGYMGIAVALVAGLHPLTIVLVSVFFGALLAGSDYMQVMTGIPVALVFVIQGLAIVLIVCRRLLQSFLERRQ